MTAVISWLGSSSAGLILESNIVWGVRQAPADNVTSLLANRFSPTWLSPLFPNKTRWTIGWVLIPTPVREYTTLMTLRAL